MRQRHRGQEKAVPPVSSKTEGLARPLRAVNDSDLEQAMGEALAEALADAAVAESAPTPGDELARETLREVVDDAINESLDTGGDPQFVWERPPQVVKAMDSGYVTWGKRAFDLGIVVALMPLWVPLYLILAIALLVFQGHPVHYLAERPGKDGTRFKMIKFRTMKPNADQMLEELLHARPDLAAQFDRHNKLHDDPRRTVLGGFLRRTSLDEVPQLWNVLKGDMTLVGPRPPATLKEEVTFYASFADHIMQHRPGLTGLWQVSSRSLAAYERKIWYDLVYAQKCSLKLDLKILLKSIPTVIRGHGAF